ncbi:hypothetical protein CARUB_v10010514mg [Capsella rubella]|uniref:Hydroxyproline-rich glycoprotein family protein n=1 Tax=Capsella rubella TaxID=81985 RepID=R0I1Z0_9BRAS|nr:uncharacterized protein LOC17898258 [Capsella rubella]EOA36269.1 hypothetical protein CARUB_v10010514mg [Capsella rubella]
MKTNDHGLPFLCLFVIFSLLWFPYLAISETPCPYPCYPTPPIGGGGSSTPSLSQPQPYPPPAGNLPNYPPPAGNIPNYPSPPYGGGDGSGGSLYGPPPPDAILPYFPYYFRKPPHQTDQTSSSSLLAVPGKLTVMIIAAVATLELVGVLGNILFTTKLV